MTRRFETGSFHAFVPLRGGRPAGIVGTALVLFEAALLLGVIGCQGGPAPHVEREPAQAVAPPSAAASSKPSAQVGLARYEEPSTTGATTGAPAPSSPAPRAPVAASDAPSKAAGGQTVQGTVVAEAPFSVWLQAESPLVAGSPATVEAVLVAKPPYHCNADYPHKFKLGAAPTGLTYPEATVRGAKITPERSVLAIPVQAQSAGKATVSGTLQFSVCNDERCLVEKRDLALALEVK